MSIYINVKHKGAITSRIPYATRAQATTFLNKLLTSILIQSLDNHLIASLK